MKKYRYYLIYFLIAFFISYLGIINLNIIKSFFNYEKRFKYKPIYKKTNTNEMDLIYIGSSICKFSNTEEMYSAIDGIKSILKKKASEYGLGFSSIGIATDLNPIDGLKHLKQMGHFNELISGNGPNNIGFIRYVGNMGAEASMPQVIIIYRIYTSRIQTNLMQHKLILDLKGERQIMDWYSKNAPLPRKFINEIR